MLLQNKGFLGFLSILCLAIGWQGGSYAQSSEAAGPLPVQWADILPAPAEAISSCLPEMQGRFQFPPLSDYPAVYWAWNGAMDEHEMARQIQDMKQTGYGTVMIFGYKGIPFEYLGQAWFEKVRIAAKLCREQGLKLWVFDDGSFPSGFANGAVTDSHPEFRQQEIAPIGKVNVLLHRGIPLDYATDEKIVAIIARRADRHGPRWSDYEPIDLTDRFQNGRFHWDAQPYNYEISIYIMKPSGRKANNIFSGGNGQGCSFQPDYLNPEPSRLFIELTQKRYLKELAEFIPDTLEGFMSDESDATKWTWTRNFLTEFETRKGYSLRPYLPLLFEPELAEESWQVQYDYRDVWTQLFCEYFQKPLAEFGQVNRLKTVFQPNQDDDDFIANNQRNGDLFRVNRIHSFPSMDVIWKQIWYGCTNDFPKVASSVAHLEGCSDVLSEEMAAYGFGTTAAHIKWITDYQLVRGINTFAMHLYSYSYDDWRPYHIPPDFSAANKTLRVHLRQFNDYAARMRTLFQTTKPQARVAIFYPRPASLAANTPDIFKNSHRIARLLLENQIDFEWIDADALQRSRIHQGKLISPGGMIFHHLLVTEQPYVPENAWNVLAELAHMGGNVLIQNHWPTLFTEAGPIGPERIRPMQNEGMILVQNDSELLNHLVAGKKPPLKIVPSCSEIRVMTRIDSEKRGCLYVVFNEGQTRYNGRLEIHKRGTAVNVEEWDPVLGNVYPASAEKQNHNVVTIPLNLYPGTTRIFWMFSDPPPRIPSQRKIIDTSDTLRLAGMWKIHFPDNNKIVSTEIVKDWNDLGMGDFSGTARYEIEFDLPGQWEGQPALLDLGKVLYAADVQVNDTKVASLPWPPYACEITPALHPGKNKLAIEVTNTMVNQFMKPKALEQADKQGCLKGTYFKKYEPLDREMFPSGLLGPVRMIRGNIGSTP